MKKILVKVALLYVVLFSVGCEKREVQPAPEQVYDVFIQELRLFMSEIGNVPIEEISYDPETEFFIWKGRPQISKDDLIFMYYQNRPTLPEPGADNWHE